MIEESHVDGSERLFQFSRDELIRLALIFYARWVLGFISGCHHHLLDWVKAVHFRTLQVAPASVRGE
jgi:hypothetical protein